MRRISSQMTFLYKWVFPVFWFVFVATALFGALGSGHHDPEFLMFLVVPILMGAFGYFMMRKLVFDLVDEVWDIGDVLLIRNRDREERVALSNIVNVNYSTLMSPERVTLLLRNPSIFGREITFCPPLRIMPFSKSR
jgi:hypothetical protein